METFYNFIIIMVMSNMYDQLDRIFAEKSNG